jgi:membrane protein DedA with SNARE-associated domain
MNDFINYLISQLHMFPLWQLILFSFISACIQQIFPPYPSEILLLLLGGLAVTNVIAGPAAIIPYIIGTVLSSLIVFYFSRRAGSPFLKNKYVMKFFSRRKQRRARVYMRRYGTPALAMCKFLPGVNTVCLIVAGVMGLRGFAPMLTIILTGIVENAAYYFAGMAIGNSLPSIYDFSKRFSFGSAAIIGSIAVIALLFVLYKNKNRLFKGTGRQER